LFLRELILAVTNLAVIIHRSLFFWITILLFDLEPVP